MHIYLNGEFKSDETIYYSTTDRFNLGKMYFLFVSRQLRNRVNIPIKNCRRKKQEIAEDVN